LGAAAFKIENVLVVTGDYTTLGDYPEAKPVFDLDSVQLLELIKKLNRGKDFSGQLLQGVPSFCPGSTINPFLEPIELQILKMKKKMAAGALFFQTQPVWEVEKFASFMKQIKGIKAKVLAGVIPLKSAKMARFMTENVPGISVPPRLVEEVEKANDPRNKGIEIAARLVKEVIEFCDGVHIMPIGADQSVPQVLKLAGLL